MVRKGGGAGIGGNNSPGPGSVRCLIPPTSLVIQGGGKTEWPAPCDLRERSDRRQEMRRLQAAAGLVTCASGMATAPRVRSSEAELPEGLWRWPSDPAPPDATEVRELVRDWTSQEATPGYFPPDNSWPWPPESGNPKAAIPALRKALSKCGAASQSECHGVAFRLATALLGGVEGHVSLEAHGIDEQQRGEGAMLMRSLAESGSVEGVRCMRVADARGQATCIPRVNLGAPRMHRTPSQCTASFSPSPHPHQGLAAGGFVSPKVRRS